MRQIDVDTVVDERYQVLEHIGSGGMADVYCATDLQLGRKVALKVLHERFAADEQFVERFKREASSAAGLQHQHLVAVYDRGEWDGTSYIAMEYVEGRTLKEVVTADGPLDPLRAIDLLEQVLRAARFAHRHGVIHRDFKPQNIIVDDEDRVKVTDFGIARAGASDITQTGSIMGTAQYLSPEQAQGHAVDAPSDLYSIGIILYELLTGRLPFEADSPVTVALKQVSEPPPPPSSLRRGVPPSLEAVVMRALAKDPAERFADADEFIAALGAARSRILAGEHATGGEAAAAALPPAAAAVPPPLAAPPAGPRAPVAPVRPVRERRKRWPWLLLAALALAGAALALASSLAPERVAVPRVVGSSVSVATQRLQSEGFEVQVVRDTSERPRNEVIGQDPAGGAVADEGARVTLTVSEGPGIRDVPDVVGAARTTARKRLTDAGFEVRETRAASPDVPPGRVVAQSPDGGSLAERGAVVRIEVSSGPERVRVPDVVGRSEDDARDALDGFRVEVAERESEDAEPGTVLAQQPVAGTALAPGATVRLTVAVESSVRRVPDVVGRTQNSATNTLSRAGFEVAVDEVAVDSERRDGRVVRQSPPARRSVERGSAVTIVVGRFEGRPPPPPPPPPPPTTTTPTTTTPGG